MGIESERVMDAGPFHQGEGCTVNEAEGLVRKCLGDSPGGIKVGSINGEDGDTRFSQGVPKGHGGGAAQVRGKQRSGFGEDQVARHEAELPYGLRVEPLGLVMVTI